MTPELYTRDRAKARARDIRAEMAANGWIISHSAALERVASEQGAADWNTLSARLSNEPDRPLQVGDRVEGRYLKQAFAGSVLAVASLAQGAAFRITVEFDEPVDVVTFDSFSALRSRVSVTVSATGVTREKTGDGIPHMVVARALTVQA